MLDRDLAELYATETRSIIQAVKRNMARFQKDFMFQLTRTEKWKHEAVLDGEMVVIDENGNSHFNSLENRYGLQCVTV